jgi:Tfp pilus assembly protein PilX
MKQPARKRPERGMALFITILILLIVTIAAVALMFNSSVENALSGNATRISRAFYAADSGIQYAAGRLANDINYVGGVVPGGMSSNTPGSSSTSDIAVTVAPPVRLGYAIHPGDEVQAQGSSYGTTQTVELIYAISATSTSTSLDATKTINAQVGIYPQQLTVSH